MSLEGPAREDRRGEPRVVFDGAVRLRYRLFQKFLEENAANISTGGMFIRTIHPGEPGSELDFEFRIDDDLPLIQGRGEVAWVRRGGGGPGKEPGMGIRFVELPEESSALVDRIVAERVAAGLELFDLASQAPPPEPPPAAQPADPQPAPPPVAPGADQQSAPPPTAPRADPQPAAPETHPVGQPDARPEASSAVAGDSADGARAPRDAYPRPLDPEMPAVAAPAPLPPGPPSGPVGPAPGEPAAGRARPLRLVAVAVLSALIGAGAVLTFFWLYVQPSIEALETRIDELAGSPGGPWQPPPGEPGPRPGAAGEASGAPAAEGATGGAAPGQPAATDLAAEVTAALRGWAAAWSEQRVADYLGYYAAGFAPPDDQTRAAWAEGRRARIERPRWIRVALTLVQVEPQEPDAAVVRFVQSYRSERYRDLVKKRMRMVREDGAWKIAEERSSS